MPAIRTDADSLTTKCPQEGCDYQLSKNSHLRRHFDYAHNTGPKRYQCVWEGCSYSDVQKSNFDDHMNVHLKRKPYSCPDCILTFANRGGLHHHRRLKHNYVSPLTRRRSTVHQDAPANPELVSQSNPSPPVAISVGKPRSLPYPFKRRATVQDKANDTQIASAQLPFGSSYPSPPSSASSTSSSTYTSPSSSSSSISSTSSSASLPPPPPPSSIAPVFPIPPPTTRHIRRLVPYPPPPPGLFRVLRLRKDIPPLRALLRTPASAWSLPAVNFDIALPRKFTLPPISDLFKVAESRSQT